MGLFGGGKKSSEKAKDAAFEALLTAQYLVNDAVAEEYGEEGDDGEFALSPEQHSGWFMENDHARIMAADLGDLLVVEYFGPDYGNGWNIFIETISRQEVADHIGELRIGGPDQGANGTRDYNFRKLFKAKAQFPALKNLWIRPTDPGDHNFSAVEEPQLSKLLATMENLENAVIPNAPSAKFFKKKYAKLASLRIGSSFQTHGFIGNLANSDNLPKLSFLDFGDSLEAWMHPVPDDDVSEDPDLESYKSATFADYKTLLESKASSELWGLRLRNARLTEQEFRALQAIKPDCQFSITLQTPHSYVSHWDIPDSSFRHMVPLR